MQIIGNIKYDFYIHQKYNRVAFPPLRLLGEKTHYSLLIDHQQHEINSDKFDINTMLTNDEIWHHRIW